MRRGGGRVGEAPAGEEPLDPGRVRLVRLPQRVDQHGASPELQFKTLVAPLEGEAAGTVVRFRARVEDGLGDGADAGQVGVGLEPEQGRPGVHHVRVPEPDHGGAAGPDAVVARALERTPHGQPMHDGGVTAVPGNVGEVLRAVEAQAPTDDPVRMDGLERHTLGAGARLDGVAGAREPGAQAANGRDDVAKLHRCLPGRPRRCLLRQEGSPPTASFRSVAACPRRSPGVPSSGTPSARGHLPRRASG